MLEDKIYSNVVKIIIEHYTSNNIDVWIKHNGDSYTLPITQNFKVIIKSNKFQNKNGLEKFTKPYNSIIATLYYDNTYNDIILSLNPIDAINTLDYYIKGVCKGMNQVLDGAWKVYFENK